MWLTLDTYHHSSSRSTVVNDNDHLANMDNVPFHPKFPKIYSSTSRDRDVKLSRPIRSVNIDFLGIQSNAFLFKGLKLRSKM